MSEIVNKYIELDKLFKQCTKNKFDGDVQLEQMRLYQVALDDFINEARHHYSNNSLDLNAIMTLFQADTTIQEELAQYNNSKNGQQSHNHL